MSFEFATAARILFGAGVSSQVAHAAAAMGRRALVVTGATPERAAPMVRQLEAAAIHCSPFPVAGEPTVDLIRGGAEYARRERCDMVIAMGGGSALDAGKALAAMLANPGDPLDYLEVIGRGQPLAHASVPSIAIPTTAGTGTEVTRNAVLASPEHRVKASLRSPGMLPRLAVVDPELTLRFAAPHHRRHRPRCPHPAHRALRFRARQSDDGRVLRGGHPPRRLGAAARLGERRRPRGPRRHGLGQPAGRPVAGQCRPGRGARVRGPGGRHVPRPARRRLRRHPAATPWR